ncbi:MAG TPA: 6,7-dimethyl-8-ribityllumazine synthase [Phycisphaerae bacterium]|nr:6,7-dimethyl-8-ribityllumazine synthase [Phycisphaerae bacterium]
MPRVLEGKLAVTDERFAVVRSRFNDFVTSKLMTGCVDALSRHGCKDENITEVRVPGSFEIPQAAQKLATSGQYDAVICLGCLIRGQTPHFEYIAAEVTKGVAQVGLETGVPVTFGIITADSLEQAVERAGAKAGNKGTDAANAAIELVNLYADISAGLSGAAKSR